MVFSLECLMIKSGLEIYSDRFPSLYIKTIIFSLLPIVLSILSGLAWYCISYLRKKIYQKETQIGNNIRVTFYIICFLAYPLILTTTFSVYSCMEMDDGKKYLRRDF